METWQFHVIAKPLQTPFSSLSYNWTKFFDSVALHSDILEMFSDRDMEKYSVYDLHQYMYALRLSLWPSGHSSWLQIERPGFDSWLYHIFWEVLGLERGPLSLASTIEELLERKSSGFGLEKRDYGHRGSAALTTRHPSIRKILALTSPASGGRSVGILRSRTQGTEFLCMLLSYAFSRKFSN
jgi:hypothetical protein